jgi:outer membrane lipoprotein-sorting protein
MGTDVALQPSLTYNALGILNTQITNHLGGKMILKQKARSAALTLALVSMGAMGLAGCGGDTATSTPVAATATSAVTAPATATKPVTTNPTATTAMAVESTATTSTPQQPTATTASGSGTGNSADALTLLKDSAAAMKNVKTFHIKLAVDASDATTNIEGDMQLPDMMRLSATVGGQTIQIIVIGGHSYTQIPGGGDSYIEGPFDSSLLTATDASAVGDFAQSATVVGDETIDGVNTTHVKFSYDADKAAQAALEAMGTPTTATNDLGMANAEMWIEKDTNYIRQFKVTSTTAGATSTTTVNYSNLNETINPPIEKPTNIATMPDIPTIALP